MKWFRMFMAVVALSFVAATAAGCNTIKGMGRDVEKGGEKVQEGAEEVQEEIREN